MYLVLASGRYRREGGFNIQKNEVSVIFAPVIEQSANASNDDRNVSQRNFRSLSDTSNITPQLPERQIERTPLWTTAREAP